MLREWVAGAAWFVCLRGYLRVLAWNERRRELVVLHDPLLALLRARDVSLVVSAATLYEVFAFAWFALRDLWAGDSDRLVLGALLACCMYAMKSLCVTLVPLRVARDNVPVKDHLLDRWVVSSPFRNDLFFSGHVAHAVIVCFTVPELFYLNACCCCAVGCAMLVSKTHYTIDVLAAPACMWLARSFVAWVDG